MNTTTALNVLLDRISREEGRARDNLELAHQMRRERDQALADCVKLTADRDKSAKNAADAIADVAVLRRDLKTATDNWHKENARAIEADNKVAAYHESLTAHRDVMRRRKLGMPAVPPSFDDDAIPF